MEYIVYGDESRHTDSDGFMTMGGVIMPIDQRDELQVNVSLWRGGGIGPSELKWDNLKGKNVRRFESFLELYFLLHETRKLDFHCLTVDNSTRNDEVYSSNNPDEGYFKLYYFLTLHRFIKFYLRGENDSLRIFLDNRKMKYDLDVLRDVLNSTIMRDMGWSKRPVKTVMPIDSEESSFIQFADILIGGIGYQKNGEHKKEQVNRAKYSMSEYIRKKAGLFSLTESTPYLQRRFTIWDFNYRSAGVPQRA